MKATHVPGLSIAVIQKAQIAWSRGFGVRADTIFEAASMSKPVFAYAVMKLHERGVLDLDTPLTRYSQQSRFVDSDPQLDQVTARHVLSHTTGLPNWRSSNHPLRISSPPGERYLYSGEGYYYLQSVVTDLMGKVDRSSCSRFEADLEVCATDFDAFMKRNVLRPLRMTTSTYLPPARMAQPHDARGNPLPVRKSTPVSVARYGAAGALLTTAADYAKFLIAVLDPKPGDRFQLSPATRDEMVRPHVKVASGEGYAIDWALGWRIARTKTGDLVSHGGDNAGFHSLAEISIARRSGFVILTNSDGGVELLKQLAPGISAEVHQS